MKTSSLAWIVAILIILIGGWYLWMQSPVPAPAQVVSTQTASSTATGSDGTPIEDNLTLGTDATTSVGTYLIAYNGMTLYTYSKDSTGTSTCYAQCAQTWPPYTVPSGLTFNLEAGVTGQAATIVRADGTDQVVYNGMPLYYYAGDKTGDDINGQGVGGVWFVAKP